MISKLHKGAQGALTRGLKSGESDGVWMPTARSRAKYFQENSGELSWECVRVRASSRDKLGNRARDERGLEAGIGEVEVKLKNVSSFGASFFFLYISRENSCLRMSFRLPS